jgi:SAM-dependent methyltransferase
MTPINRFLQDWRIRKAAPFIAHGDRVLDLGRADGALFERVGHCGPGSMGIDPTLAASTRTRQGFRMIRGHFPDSLPADAGPFDAIVMLAVLGQIPADRLGGLARGCARLLKPGGRLVITVPSLAADAILGVLAGLRWIHGNPPGENHGHDVAETPSVFGAPAFRLALHDTFQLGLNHRFVFERTAAA